LAASITIETGAGSSILCHKAAELFAPICESNQRWQRQAPLQSRASVFEAIRETFSRERDVHQSAVAPRCGE
jgi:hypothetical protein